MWDSQRLENGCIKGEEGFIIYAFGNPVALMFSYPSK